jgi:HlyD family secretion protein
MRASPTSWLVAALVLLLGVLAAVLALPSWLASRAPQAITLQTAPVARGDIARRVSATGATRPTSVVHVGALVSGIIASTRVRAGDRVEAGQVIATIEDDAFRLQLARAQAAFRAARLRDDEARRQLRRQEGLLERGFVSEASVEAARSQWQLATEDVAAARTDVETARLQLAHCRIASPIAGIVLSTEIAAGQSVASAFQVPDLFTIVSGLDRLEVVAMFAEADLANVAVGAAATLTVPAWPERIFSARVERVLNTPENRQGVVMFPVVLAIENDAGLLRPGMTAYVEIRVVTRRGVMTVPNQAIAFARGKDRSGGLPADGPRHLYARRGEAVRPIAVRLGESDESNTEITALDALDEHEQILLKETP